MTNSHFKGSTKFEALIDHTSGLGKEATANITNVIFHDGILPCFFRTTGLMAMTSFYMDQIAFRNITITNSYLIHIKETATPPREDLSFVISNTNLSNIKINSSQLDGLIFFDFEHTSFSNSVVHFENISMSQLMDFDHSLFLLEGEMSQINFKNIKISETTGKSLKIIDGNFLAHNAFLSNITITDSENVQLISNSIEHGNSLWKIVEVRGESLSNSIPFLEVEVNLDGNRLFSLTNSTFSSIKLNGTSLFRLTFKDNLEVSCILDTIDFSSITVSNQTYAVLALVSLF